MSGSASSEEKALPPSEKKLRDARKKGQVAKSRDLVTAAVSITGFGYVVARASPLSAHLLAILRDIPTIENQDFHAALATLVSRLAILFATELAPLFVLLVMAAVLASLMATGGPVVSVDPLLPKFERINPFEGLKRLVGLRPLTDLLKSLVKIAILLASFLALSRGVLGGLVEEPGCGLGCVPRILSASLLPLLGASGVVFVAVGFADVGLQRWLFRRDQRMTRTEQRKEQKNLEGEPHVRNERRRQRREAAASRSGMRQATFVLMSSKAAVALRYSSLDTKVPTVVARAEADGMADLLQQARQRVVPILFEPQITTLILDRIPVGRPITKDMFNPVIGCMKRLSVLG